MTWTMTHTHADLMHDDHGTVADADPTDADPSDADPSDADPSDADLAGPSSGVARPWNDAGMATAEYAIATVAAAGFAGLLLVILRSNEVRALLLGIIRGALSV